ncbi:hypothetical protein [uncultured Thermanaerothrix sp.]|uniref:hypothetical protein n=1 Tax=uncultured Thermanaerothrix sp. TaxID=1195149 RepID=UPI0026024F5F|nr:hypothetical protein [uncultured Thermanaerothrix sp.]
MLADWLAFPLLGGLLMIQTAIISRLTLLSGSGDLILLALIAWALHERVRSALVWVLAGGLLVGWVSGMPLLLPLIGYGLVVALARMIRRQVWQIPLLAMLFVTFWGTLIYHALTIVVLQFSGSPLPWESALTHVTLPSLFLNIVLAFPVYALFNDLANWLYPETVVKNA